MSHTQKSRNYYEQSLVWGKGKKGMARNMSLRRKSGPGVGNFSTITLVTPNGYQRERARQARLGAHHREWVLGHTARQIAKLVV